MSAQILLSMIAPALPAAPQGAAADASGEFSGLLAGLMGAGGKAPVLPETLPPAADEGTDADEAGLVLAPATPAPAPAIAATGSGPAGAAATEAVPIEGEEPPPVLPPAPDTSPATKGKGEAPEVMPPAPSVADGGGAAVRPGLRDAVARTLGDAAGEAPTDAPSPSPSPSPWPSAPAAEGARTAAGGPATLPPAAATPAPQPLRAPVDRAAAANSPDVRDAEAPSAASADPAARGAAASQTPAIAARPVGGPPSVPPVATEAAAASPDEPASDAGPRGEAPAADPAAPAASRDAAPPTLSRGAIEATAQIAAQILRKLDGRATRFEMALLPEELGRVDIKLDIDSEGRLAARLAFDNPAAAADLRGRADELRRQLEQAGFHLAEDAFEFAERDSGSSAFDRGEDARRGSGRAFAAASRLNAETDAPPPSRWTSLSLTPEGVDLKV